MLFSHSFREQVFKKNIFLLVTSIVLSFNQVNYGRQLTGGAAHSHPSKEESGGLVWEDRLRFKSP